MAYAASLGRRRGTAFRSASMMNCGTPSAPTTVSSVDEDGVNTSNGCRSSSSESGVVCVARVLSAIILLPFLFAPSLAAKRRRRRRRLRRQQYSPLEMEQHRRCFAPTTGHRAVLEEEDVDALYIDDKDSFCEDVKIHLKKEKEARKRTRRRRHRLLRLGLLKRTNEVRVH